MTHKVGVVLASGKWDFSHVENELLTKVVVIKALDYGMGGKLLQELFRESALEFYGCQLHEFLSL